MIALLFLAWAAPFVIDNTVWTVQLIEPEECETPSNYLNDCFGVITCENRDYLIGCIDRIDRTINMDINNLDFIDAEGLATFEHELKHIVDYPWWHKVPFEFQPT